MRLNLHTDFGLRALMFLGSRPDDWITTAEMARTLGIPRNHLLKVVSRMIELGWVAAKRGPSGGVRFEPGTTAVSVGEIVRGLEHKLALVECFDPQTNTCPIAGACLLAPLLYRARGAFMAELDAVQVGELVASVRVPSASPGASG